MIRLFTLVLVMSLCTQAFAQIHFSKSAPSATAGFFSGVAAMVTDANGDGRDDIIRLQRGNQLTVTLQGQEGLFLNTYEYQLNGGEQWNITGGDLQNDGGFDILMSGVYDRVKVFRAVPFSHAYTYTTIPDNTFFGQACNLVDINNDGWLDHYVCHDDGKNVIFMNDGAGGLVRVDTIIDFTTIPASDNSGNYGSIWTDIDSDGDLDLHIAKCRAGANDPADPRRINALYLNNGDGTFSERADSFHLAIGAQSWTADFGDIDNDGDFDIIITNHNIPGQLLENIDNAYFEDITASAGVSVNGIAMQGTFRDFDNDGLQDIIVSGTSNYIYRNLGNRQFELVGNPFSERNITSYGIGDLNSDGFLDIYATYNNLYNDPSNVLEDVIWLNDGNPDNHYLRVMLVGVNTNRNAVGARLNLYQAGGRQTREVHAGEGYGITNSLIQHFGLGQDAHVDSLEIVWPNGTREVYKEVEPDRTLVITEGGCISALLELPEGPFVQCDSTEFDLTAPDGYLEYLWSDGDTAQTRTTRETGIYHVSMTDDQGCTWIAGPVLISPASDIEPDVLTLSVDGFVITCRDQPAVISASGSALSYLWSTGDSTATIAPTESGSYWLEAGYVCKTLVSDTVSITVVDPNDVVFTNDTLYAPGTGTLHASGDSIVWYDGDLNAVGSGSAFVTDSVDSTTTFFARHVAYVQGGQFTGGQSMHTGLTLYNGNMTNGALRFNVLERLRLDSVLVMTEFPGKRTITVTDEADQEVYRQTFQIDSGAAYVPMGVWIEPGLNYLITTDRDSNQVVFGVNSPRLIRSNGGFLYPFVIPDVLEITGSLTGQEFYYYFYDWHVTLEDQYCIGDLQPVQVVVLDTTSSTHALQIDALQLMPNPATTEVSISPADLMQRSSQIALFDISGRRVSGWHADPATGYLHVEALTPGIYTIRLETHERVWVGRFIKA